jgi:hypothetical protein
MIIIVQANGAAIKADMSLQDFMALIAAVVPSSWVNVTDLDIGPIMLNTFAVAYVYQVV